MECKLQLIVVLAIVAGCYGATFNNPVYKSVKQEHIFFYENFYYMVAVPDQGQPFNWFPIYVSSDLESWTRISYAFDNMTKPLWANNFLFDSPFIHYRGGAYYLLFGGFESNSISYKIGVAKSKSLAGPYAAEAQPLAIQVRKDVYDPKLIVDNENGDTYLLWTSSDQKTITGQQIHLLNSTLLSSPQTVLGVTLSWERYVEAPHSVYRNGYYYLFYTGGGYCTANSAIGVARSKSPLGPYEKLGNPIITGSAAVPNIVKEPSGRFDAILYQSSCSLPSSMNAATLVWGADNWPILIP